MSKVVKDQVARKYVPSRPIALGMRKYLAETFVAYIRYGDNIPSFPYRARRDREYYVWLTWDTCKNREPDAKIRDYLIVCVGKGIDVTPPDLGFTVVTEDQEKERIREAQAAEALAAVEEFSKHAQIFLDKANISQGVITLIAMDQQRAARNPRYMPKFLGGLTEGCRYALSEHRKFDFFVKYPQFMPESVKKILESLRIIPGETKNATTLAMINSNDRIIAILDKELTRLILGLGSPPNLDCNFSKMDVREITGRLTELERYIMRNMNWKEKTRRDTERKRRKKEASLPEADKDTGAKVDFGTDEKFISASVESTEDIARQVETLKEISIDIVTGVLKLSRDVADWLRERIITEEWTQIDGKVVLLNVTSKQRREWLQWADILEVYADICQFKLAVEFDPKNLDRLERRIGSVRGDIVWKMEGGKAVFKVKETYEGIPIDWKAPKLRELVSNDELKEAIDARVNMKWHILHNYTTKYRNGEVTEKELAEEFEVSEFFIVATMMQGMNNYDSLKIRADGEEWDPVWYRGYLNHRIIAMLPGILQICQQHPEYTVDIRDAFFSMTAVHGHIYHPVWLDEDGKLEWIKFTNKQKDQRYDPDTGLPMIEPRLRIGGMRNMFDSKRSNADIIYEIIEQPMKPEYWIALEDAGIYGNKPERETVRNFTIYEKESKEESRIAINGDFVKCRVKASRSRLKR